MFMITTGEQLGLETVNWGWNGGSWLYVSWNGGFGCTIGWNGGLVGE
jgi:hypothetical protein